MDEGVNMRIMGVDISMNHGAFLLLNNDMLIDYRFVTDKAVLARKNKSRATLIKTKDIKDKIACDFYRLDFWQKYSGYILNYFQPDYLGVEGYAYKALQYAHQIGGVGAIFRLEAWKRQIKIRVHGPETVKLFAADKGNASKEDVIDYMSINFPESLDFEKYRHNKDTTIQEDLCDGLAIAKLVNLEIKLRTGQVEISSLPSKTIQIFNRTTKTYPVNILARDWYYR